MNSRLLALLAVGGAPSYWAREIARPAARMAALRRASAWIETFAAIQPSLRYEPLLGNCLADLVFRASRPAADEPEAAHQASPRFARSVGRAARATPAVGEAAHPDAAQMLERPARLPRMPNDTSTHWPHPAHPRPIGLARRADGGLLRRLADGSDQPVVAAQPRDRPAVSSGVSRFGATTPRARARREALPFAPRARAEPGHQLLERAPRRGGVALPSWDDELAARHAWHAGLAELVGRTLRRAGLPPAAPTEQRRVRLARQWSTPIARAVVSGDLLIRLAGLSAREGGAAHDRDHGPGALPRTRGNQPRQARATGDRGSADSDGAIAPAPPQSKRRELSPPSEQHGKERSLERVSTTNDRTEQIAPPSMVAQLPPLLPPQVIGLPVPAIAAAVARQGAQFEAAAVEDLDLLAARIKCILDEEARRHGIDV